jgi:hypothetical protein
VRSKESLKQKAKGFEEESEHEMHLQHSFVHAVALIQVALALSAVAALTRIKSVWLFSMVTGAVGIYMFIQGFVAK